MLDFIEIRQSSWWGHLQRIEDSRLVKHIWDLKIKKRKRRGIFRQMWDGVVGEILKRRGTNWRQTKILSRNTKIWADFVYQK